MRISNGQNNGRATSSLTPLDIERNVKNNLYYFILSKGLFKELREYEMNNDMTSPSGHGKVITHLSFNLPEKMN